MAKKNKSKTSDYVGFRAKTEGQKEEFYNRANNLKGKGFSKADIFEAGLLALENGSSIEQIQRKKNKCINERDFHLSEALSINSRIEALNRQLINKPEDRFKDLEVKDHVLTVEITDSSGNKIKF